MATIIQPKILKGTRDFLPKDMAQRKSMMNTIENIFKKFGYDTIETPVIEYAETILGKYGDEGDQLTYTFEDRGNRQIALRYDQTVPTARFVAMYNHDLPIPFKRYQISRVWRADKPQKGRYREFYQCDIDIIGTQSLTADAEMAKVIYEVFQALGFTKFVTKINTRKLTNALLKKIGIEPEKNIEVIRRIDKLDKIGVDGVKSELHKIDVSQDAIEQLFEILLITGNNTEKLDKINMSECDEIRDFLRICKDFGIPEEFIEVDVSLARGLDYYTGVIFETIIEDSGVGSVCGGGRYDNLCEMFTKQPFPGTGIAFGFDRIYSVMTERNMFSNTKLNSQVLVAVFNEEMQSDALQILNTLHKNNISSEVYIQAAKLGKQFKYADKKEIPYVIIQGPDEKEQNLVQLKNMITGEEQKLSLKETITLLTK